MALRLLRFSEAAAAAEAAIEGSARILGGGTLLVRALNMGDVAMDTLIQLDQPASRDIVVSADGWVELGGRVNMAQVARDPGLGWLAPVALSIGGPAVRSMATVAGNLHAPSPYGDFATALLALDATVMLQGPDGRAELPIASFLAGRNTRYARTPILGVRFKPPAPAAFRFRKASRTKPKGVAILTIAAVIERDAGGVITRVRIAYGALAEAPVRAAAAEAALLGRSLTDEGIAPALAVAASEVAPPDDPISSGWYKRAVLPVHLRRLFLETRS